MSQEAIMSEDDPLSLGDRLLPQLGDTVLARELGRVLAAGTTPAVARFQSRSPERPPPDDSGRVEPGTGTGATGSGAE